MVRRRVDYNSAVSSGGSCYAHHIHRHRSGQDARAVLFRIKYDTAGLGPWVHRLSQRAPRNKVVVAIATN
jgi:hypothetical protein